MTTVLKSPYYHCPSLFQVVPHITDAIKNWIERVSTISVDGKDGPPDICVIELGGTVGRCYESLLSKVATSSLLLSSYDDLII